MAKGFKHGAGGGGASLNFKVVCNPQPASPKENTIWVNTDVAITSWAFSATEPENPSEGMVWISTGTSSPAEFNALKKNSIQVHPLSAKQYSSGAWVEREAKSYQNGAWVEWTRYIFKSGEGAIVPLKHLAQANASATHTTDIIVHSYTSGDVLALTVTEEAVKLSGFSTLYVRAKCTKTSSEYPGTVGFYSTAPTSAWTKPDIASVKFNANSSIAVYSVPVPTGVETAFIGAQGMSKFEIYDIWME